MQVMHQNVRLDWERCVLTLDSRVSHNVSMIHEKLSRTWWNVKKVVFGAPELQHTSAETKFKWASENWTCLNRRFDVLQPQLVLWSLQIFQQNL